MGIIKIPKMKEELLAYIIGILTGDGHYQKNRSLPSLSSKKKTEIMRCKKILYELGFTRTWLYKDLSKGLSKKSNPRYMLFITDRKKSRTLEERGLPAGNKTNINFNIPNWIIKGNKRIKTAYIRGLFDAEGSIYKTKKNKKAKERWRIAFAMCKNETLQKNAIDFFNEVKNILLESGIKTSPIQTREENIRKDGSKSLYFRFEIQKSQFEKFYKEVGFWNLKKKRLLERVVKPHADVF